MTTTKSSRPSKAPKKRKRGRPRFDPADKITVQRIIRMTAVEYAELVAACPPLTPVATWAREVVLAHAAAPSPAGEARKHTGRKPRNVVGSRGKLSLKLTAGQDAEVRALCPPDQHLSAWLREVLLKHARAALRRRL